jgi:hypothetical protein
MIRHPMLDFYTGALLAMGGPMALMLPQRIFMEMMSGAAALPAAEDRSD